MQARSCPRNRKSSRSESDLLLSFLQMCLCCGQSLRQLIGAGGNLRSAADAFHTGNDLVNVHAFHQRSDALQVAVAAAKELDVLYFTVFNFKCNLTGAGSLCLIVKFHEINPFCIQIFDDYTILFLLFQEVFSDSPGLSYRKGG